MFRPEVPYAVAAMKKIPQQVVMDLINLKIIVVER